MTVQLQSEQEQATAEQVARVLAQHPELSDPTLSPFKKKLAARRILNHLRGRMDEADREKTQLNALIESMQDFEAWSKTANPILQKNDCSRFHKIIRWLKLASKKYGDVEAVKGDPHAYDWKGVQPFVVQHNWVAAFQNAGDYAEGTFNLPFERTAFEFRISGKSVTVLAQQDEGCAAAFRCYAECGEAWISDEKNGDTHPPFLLALAAVKAICVALDAEVATHQVVRASEKVNRRREREGKIPFFSYHIVSLAHRSRVANPLGGTGGATTKKRLHFRRGHWRHYADFKSWVRWTLVGNPDLGFIDKEYRL